jgi:hypothetical protein
MSKRRRRLRGTGERWVGLPHWLMNSPAFRSLPGDAVKLLLAVWQRHNGINNGEISYSCREAAEIGLARSQAARMFDILIERGFLVIGRGSTFNNKKLSRTWRLTAEKRGPEKATKDFMRWQSETTNGTGPKFFPSPTGGTHSPTGGTMAPKLPATVPWVGLYGRKRPLQ